MCFHFSGCGGHTTDLIKSFYDDDANLVIRQRKHRNELCECM